MHNSDLCAYVQLMYFAITTIFSRSRSALYINTIIYTYSMNKNKCNEIRAQFHPPERQKEHIIHKHKAKEIIYLSGTSTGIYIYIYIITPRVKNTRPIPGRRAKSSAPKSVHTHTRARATKPHRREKRRLRAAHLETTRRNERPANEIIAGEREGPHLHGTCSSFPFIKPLRRSFCVVPFFLLSSE